MRNRTLILFLGLAGLFLSSCSYQDVEMEEITSVNFEKVSAEKIKLKISAKISNPNNYPITIVNSDLNIFIANKLVGAAKLDRKIKLPKKSKMVHSFAIETDLQGIKKAVMPSIFSVLANKAVTARIAGTIKTRVIIAGKKFDVDFSDEVNLVDLLFQ